MFPPLRECLKERTESSAWLPSGRKTPLPCLLLLSLLIGCSVCVGVDHDLRAYVLAVEVLHDGVLLRLQQADHPLVRGPDVYGYALAEVFKTQDEALVIIEGEPDGQVV